MVEFNVRVSSIDQRGLMEVAESLRSFIDLPCEVMVGRSEIISEIRRFLPEVINAKEIYSDSEIVGGVDCKRLKGEKFPIDLAITMSGSGYLIIKGKTVFGAIGEVEGHSLALRVIANIKRNFT